MSCRAYFSETHQRKFRSILSPPPSLVSINFLWPPGARAIFLHSNVLYNNIWFVTEGHKKHWGGGGGGENRSENFWPEKGIFIIPKSGSWNVMKIQSQKSSRPCVWQHNRKNVWYAIDEPFVKQTNVATERLKGLLSKQQKSKSAKIFRYYKIFRCLWPER